VRYADDFVVMVYGTKDHAHALWDEIEDVLSKVGLRLAAEKTHLAHLDEGFDFLGFRIQRHKQWGSDRRLIYSYPSAKSQAAIRRKVKEATKYQTTNQSPATLFRRISQMVRGWCLYFRHGASKTAFLALENFVWHRVWTWLRNKHPRRHWKWIRRRYYPQRGNPEIDGERLYSTATMTIKRHQYRGNKIPTPWSRWAARQTTA
jgi:RNA-directed DNA polymerase